MSAKVTETDLADLKELIISSQKEIEKTIEISQKTIETRLTALEIGQAKTNEKIDGLSTRLGILEGKTTQQLNWFLAIVTGLVGGLLTFLFRSFPQPPTA
jgi:Zn-dependent M16 (insulinase) family peptidase